MLRKTLMIALSVFILAGLMAFTVDANEGGWNLDRSTSYASKGYEEGPVPTRFFDVPTITQRFKVGYVGMYPNMSLGLNYQRPETGSGYDDRLSISLGMNHTLGLFDFSLEHRYTHTDTNQWLTGDGYMTILRGDVQSDGIIKPYIYVVSSYSAESLFGFDNLDLFGGFGLSVEIPLILPVFRQISFGASIADSFIHDGDNRMTPIQLSVGSEVFVNSLNLTLIPELSIVRDVRDMNLNPGYHWSISAPF